MVLALASAWAVAAFGFTLFTLRAVVRFSHRIANAPTPSAWPAIVVVRPLAGDEPGLADRLRSSARYPGACEVLLLVSSPSDPAHAVAAAIADQDARFRVLVTACDDAANHKVAQLERGWQHLRAREPFVLVTADSDVHFAHENLPALVRALLADAHHGAAFAPPVETAIETAGDRAAVGLLTASHHDFLALAALADATGGVVSLAGALSAYHSSALHAIGGFAPYTNVLGEDFELARTLRAKNYSVGVAEIAARCPESGRSFREVADRTARWMMVVRKQRGALILTYPLLIAPTPLLWLCALCVREQWCLWLFAASLTTLRTFFAHRLRRLHQLPVSFLTAARLVMAAELLLLACLPRALASNIVWWRGRCLRVEKEGRISLVR